MPVNFDGSSLIAQRSLTGGSQLTPNASGSGDYNTRIGTELPQFVDGPSVYAYARSAPAFNVDSSGLQSVSLPRTGIPEKLKFILAILQYVRRNCVDIDRHYDHGAGTPHMHFGVHMDEDLPSQFRELGRVGARFITFTPALDWTSDE